jgi:copper(I)-binding protein
MIIIAQQGETPGPGAPRTPFRHRPMPNFSTTRTFFAGFALCLASCMASVANAQAKIAVENAWARATVPGQKVGAIYLEMRSEKSAKLIGVSSAAAGSAEIHSMSNDGGVMKMRQLKQLELPAGQTVPLAPSGNHIMLLDLKQPLQAGARVPLVLIVEQEGKKQSIPLQVEVRALTP